MESFTIKHVSFTYPNRHNSALTDINLVINQGEFVTICGKSGCGKTTLLRLLKTALAPHGEFSGEISFEGKPLPQCDAKVQAQKIGFVLQSPDNQIVTDKVWHELAFGLESLGFSTPEIRTRVSEMASFFGIEKWFHQSVSELSGGQKQLLNLASVMVMQPSVLILDEPTSQLDPIAAGEFLSTLQRINRELGTTVIITEHRLEEVFPVSDTVIVMDEGKILTVGSPDAVGEFLKDNRHDLHVMLPTPMRVYAAVDNELACPLTVREGRQWLEAYAQNHILQPELIPASGHEQAIPKPVVEMKHVWFRYEKDMPDVIKGMNLAVGKGELFVLLGGNGTGKTTALSLLSGLYKPYRGKILIQGENISDIRNLYKGLLGVLPQNPQSVFVRKTVELDLLDMLSDSLLTEAEKTEKVQQVASACGIEHILLSHPYDISGGEQQRAALAKVLLSEPEILLLDEPTKGMDAHFKERFADLLYDLKNNGATVIMVSHDVEFCARYADRCALVFDGSITSCDEPRRFFAGKRFYTTVANRMAATRLPQAVLSEDIILACGGKIQKKDQTEDTIRWEKTEQSIQEGKPEKKKLAPWRMLVGGMFVLLFILTSVFAKTDFLPGLQAGWLAESVLQALSIAEAFVAFLCFFPKRSCKTAERVKRSAPKLSKHSALGALFLLLAVPITIFAGIRFFGGRKYYFISLLIILETMIPFLVSFESRKPQARELVVVGVLCALSVTSRAAFFMLPQFKPVVALIIIAGACFGGETGFLVGVVTGFVSNFFFGQGPWTPWQMFSFGMIGGLAGLLFQTGFLCKNKLLLSIFGFFAVLVIFGGIMNPASILMVQTNITKEMLLSSYIVGLPFDLVHAGSTAFFLWFCSEIMIEKLERIQLKYGILKP